MNNLKQEEGEEYAIYAAVIEAMYISNGASVMVIENQTLPIGHIDQEWSESVTYVSQNLPGVLQDTIDSFRIKNEQSHPLSAIFALNIDYSLISKEEKRDIYEKDGWHTFNSKYPKAQGILRFSRVGFGHSMNQALVYIQDQRGYKTGEGFYVLLVKESNTWIVKDKYQWMVS